MSVALPIAPVRRSLVAVLLVVAVAAGCRPESGPAASPVPLESASGPLTHAPRPTSAGISAADLRTRIYILADDSMLGREAGGPGNVKATDYVAAELARLGLEPAGDGGTFFQDVPMITRPLDSARTRLVAAGRTLELWRDWAPVPPAPALLFSGGKQLDGVQVVFGGRVGDESSLITEQQAAGKLVIVLPALGAEGRPQSRFDTQAGMTRMANAAAVAVVQLDEARTSSLAAAMRVRGGLIDPAEPPMSTRPAGIYLSRAAAEALLGKPLASARPGDAGGTVQGEIAYRVERPAFPARNVVAILRGSDAALRGQYVAVGAHTDHVGFARRAVDHDSMHVWLKVYRPIGANGEALPDSPERAQRFAALLDSVRRANPVPRRDSIFNGADDDASGTAVALEVAEQLARAADRPRRSVLFVFHTAEEKGLYGSEWFTTHSTVPRDSIVANFNMDMVGRGDFYLPSGNGRPHLQLIGSRRLSTELGAVMDSVNAALPTPLGIDYSFDAAGHPLNRYCRSDHWNYARFGIPIAFISLGYGSDYHQLTDEPQYIRYEHSALVGQLLHDATVAVANRDRRLVVDKPKPNPRGICRQ